MSFYPNGNIIVEDIEALTREEWLTARRAGVGSSDVPVLAGYHQYHTPYSLWEDKTCRSAIDSGESEAAWWGKRLEPVIAETFVEREGGTLVDTPHMVQAQFSAHHLASPDFGVNAIGGTSLIECKLRRNPFDEPAQHLVDQCQWQMHVTGIDHTFLVVLFAGQQLVHWSLPRDDDRIEYLKFVVDDFWSHVTADTPPDPMPVDTRRMLPKQGELVLRVDDIDRIAEARRLKAEAKAMADRADELLDPVRLALVDHHTALSPDMATVATYKPNTRGTRTLLTKAAAEQ